MGYRRILADTRTLVLEQQDQCGLTASALSWWRACIVRRLVRCSEKPQFGQTCETAYVLGFVNTMHEWIKARVHALETERRCLQNPRDDLSLSPNGNPSHPEFGFARLKLIADLSEISPHLLLAGPQTIVPG